MVDAAGREQATGLDSDRAARRARQERMLAPALMAMLMSLVMSGFVTVVNLGFRPSFIADWAKAWAVVLPVAVCAVYIAAPIARRLARRIIGLIWRDG